jgi:hypothetical protein
MRRAIRLRVARSDGAPTPLVAGTARDETDRLDIAAPVNGFYKG